MTSQISLRARNQSTFVLQDIPEGSESTQDRPFAVDVAVKILHSSPPYTIHDALLRGSKSECRRFLNLGHKDRQDVEGDTPLHVAIKLDCLYSCTLILKKNPNLLLENCSQHMPMTPIELAEELNRQALIVKLLRHVNSLDAVVPKARQVRFLAGLWYRGNVEAISLAAKQYLPKPIYHSNVYTFSYKSLSALDVWIKNPLLRPCLIKFSFIRKDWEVILYHFIGKKALLFAKDRKHLYEGSYTELMYMMGLWTWRNFWHTEPPSNNQLYRAIDTAIGEAINLRSHSTIVKKIQEGTDPVILPTGWYEHSLAVVFIGSLLFICNRGDTGTLQTHDLTAYRIKKNAITKELVSKILSLRSDASPMSTASAFLFDTLPKALDGRVDGFCDLIHAASCQPTSLDKPICTAANLRLAIQAILLSQADKEDGLWNFAAPMGHFKDYVVSARYSILHKYLSY
ncbi:MAG: ankyrin repeat domain-containing protein [Chlamydiales bacterium]|nr:ankyrin repeat domain-containing protein [Chlamydiales bacterium]